MDEVISNWINKSCLFQIVGKELITDFIVININIFDIILGMDWLASQYATFDFHEKRVNFEIPKFSFIDSCTNTSPRIVFSMQIKQFLKNKCMAYLATLVDTRQKDQKLEDIPVVNEYPNIFPKYLCSLPLDREVEFAVNLIPRKAQ